MASKIVVISLATISTTVILKHVDIDRRGDAGGISELIVSGNADSVYFKDTKSF